MNKEAEVNLAIVFVILSIISINFFHHAESASSPHSINQSNSNQVDKGNNIQQVEDVWSKWLFIVSLITILVTLSAIGATVAIYRHQQNKEANQTRNTILLEVRENKKVLLGNMNERIVYTTTALKGGDVKEVNYTNAYLELDAYESGLHSGFITHLPTNSQHVLTALYSRIRSRNELITYTDRFQDLFFLSDDTNQRLDRWYKAVERYDVLITRWEQEIIKLLEETEALLDRKN